MKKMYQIGSVVELKAKEGEELIPFIIIGRLMQQSENEIYDYIGLPYPYGFTGAKSFASFDEEQITTVLHNGFETEMSNELQLFYQEKCRELESSK